MDRRECFDCGGWQGGGCTIKSALTVEGGRGEAGRAMLGGRNMVGRFLRMRVIGYGVVFLDRGCRVF